MLIHSKQTRAAKPRLPRRVSTPPIRRPADTPTQGMGNRFLIEDALQEEFGADTTVVHKCGMPLTVATSIEGKQSKRECLPAYL